MFFPDIIERNWFAIWVLDLVFFTILFGVANRPPDTLVYGAVIVVQSLKDLKLRISDTCEVSIELGHQVCDQGVVGVLGSSFLVFAQLASIFFFFEPFGAFFNLDTSWMQLIPYDQYDTNTNTIGTSITMHMQVILIQHTSTE